MDVGGLGGAAHAQQLQGASNAQTNAFQPDNQAEEIEPVVENNEQQRSQAFQAVGLGNNVDQLV